MLTTADDGGREVIEMLTLAKNISNFQNFRAVLRSSKPHSVPEYGDITLKLYF